MEFASVYAIFFYMATFYTPDCTLRLFLLYNMGGYSRICIVYSSLFKCYFRYTLASCMCDQCLKIYPLWATVLFHCIHIWTLKNPRTCNMCNAGIKCTSHTLCMHTCVLHMTAHTVYLVEGFVGLQSQGTLYSFHKCVFFF